MDENLALRVTLLPKDTNGHGTIFGGVILSQIDLAGAVEAARHTMHKVVTIAMDRVVFKKPVFVGDVVSLYTKVLKVGEKSITIAVRVVAERGKYPRDLVDVTSAEIVFVSVDENGKSIPLNS